MYTIEASQMTAVTGERFCGVSIKITQNGECVYLGQQCWDGQRFRGSTVISTDGAAGALRALVWGLGGDAITAEMEAATA